MTGGLVAPFIIRGSKWVKDRTVGIMRVRSFGNVKGHRPVLLPSSQCEVNLRACRDENQR